MSGGWFCIWRKIEDNISWSRGVEYRGLMITILQKANWKKGFFLGHEILPGQFPTSAENLAKDLKLSRQKCQRAIAQLARDNFINVKNVSNRFTLITVTNWDTYQDIKEGSEQQVSNQRATSEQQVGTIEQGNKETKKSKTPSPAKPEPKNWLAERTRIVTYLNKKIGTGYQQGSQKTATSLNARLNEGYKPEDFKTVIDSKVAEWGNDAGQKKYLRPETLFGGKFEGYLQATKMNISNTGTSQSNADAMAEMMAGKESIDER